jgi:hypothetical protein
VKDVAQDRRPQAQRCVSGSGRGVPLARTDRRSLTGRQEPPLTISSLLHLSAQELRKIGDEIATYDEHLTKFYAPDAWSASGSILPAREKDKLVAEAKASNGRLTRSRQVLIGLLKKCSTESADGREMKENKDQIEEVRRCFASLTSDPSAPMAC